MTFSPARRPFCWRASSGCPLFPPPPCWRPEWTAADAGLAAALAAQVQAIGARLAAGAQAQAAALEATTAALRSEAAAAAAVRQHLRVAPQRGAPRLERAPLPGHRGVGARPPAQIPQAPRALYNKKAVLSFKLLTSLLPVETCPFLLPYGPQK